VKRRAAPLSGYETKMKRVDVVVVSEQGRFERDISAEASVVDSVTAQSVTRCRCLGNLWHPRAAALILAPVAVNLDGRVIPIMLHSRHLWVISIFFFHCTGGSPGKSWSFSASRFFAEAGCNHWNTPISEAKCSP
jgi:hypothetical protein